MSGGVTPECAVDYGRRCQAIGQERRNTADLQDAMSHPDFKPRHHQLLDELAAEYRQTLPLIERPAFATIQIGTFKEIADLRQALTAGGFRIGDWASDLMGRPEFTLVAEPTEVKLYAATVAELGYPNGCTVAEIIAAIEKIGGVKLPAEAGPQYRLQCLDQLLGEWRLMYQEPITDSDGGLEVFHVVRDESGRWLHSGYAGPEDFYDGDGVWVFGRKS